MSVVVHNAQLFVITSKMWYTKTNVKKVNYNQRVLKIKISNHEQFMTENNEHIHLSLCLYGTVTYNRVVSAQILFL